MPTGDTTRFPFKSLAEAPQPIIAKPEQPPFAPKQFVRIKSSGTVLNVARCEKRVVHGALRWVVDDLNGMRAFAADCELIKNMELVNAETGEAVIHLEPQPEVSYACSKLAAVGDPVKIIGGDIVRYRVSAIRQTGDCELQSPFGAYAGAYAASSLEFVPDVTPVAAADFDFDEAANKAATEILHSLAGTTGLSHEWASDIISAQIRPGVRHLYAKLQHRRCDTCGANTIDGCMRCGAPQCCPQCCKIAEYEQDQATSNVHHLMALKLLNQCGATLFLLGDYEARLKGGKWSLQKCVMGSWVWQGEFDSAVQAALRAKELADVGKVST